MKIPFAFDIGIRKEKYDLKFILNISGNEIVWEVKKWIRA